MNKLYRYFVVLLILSISISTEAQEIRITKGKILDSIPVRGDSTETFALYLPQSIDTVQKYPVLFVFDPEGRGRMATQVFRSIAEEQAYIIVASNENLKQDSLQSNIPKATRLMTSTLGALPIDPNLVYVGGLQKGAQLASAVPVVYNNIKGVLAIGDAWVNPDFISKENPFAFNAVVGYEDYKLHDMRAFVDLFDNIGFPVELSYFPGGPGEWPETKVLSNAVTGFRLQAISEGLMDGNSEGIQQLYENEVEYAEVLRRRREYFHSYEKLQQIEQKYEAFDFEDDIKERMKNLRRTKAFRQQRREFRRAATEEKERQEEYIMAMEADVITANFENVGWWAYQLEELEEAQRNGDPAQSEMAYRLEGFLDRLSKHHYNLIAEEASIDSKIFISVLRTVFDKEDPQAYLNIIALAGHDGDYETAMLYLEDLLKTGFDDMQALYDIDGILDLKMSREYNEKIKEYLGTSKYYKVESDED